LVTRVLERLDDSPELALLRQYIVDNDPQRAAVRAATPTLSATTTMAASFGVQTEPP
jgi:hypothetical protein